MGLPAVIADLRRHPGMYIETVTLDSVIAFLTGYDAAMSNGVLVGFREWLVVRANDGSNLAWPGLVQILVTDPRAPDDSPKIIGALFDILEEFIAAREAHDGLRRIYLQYESWLRRQTWYKPGFPSWVSMETKRRRLTKTTIHVDRATKAPLKPRR